MTINVVSLQNAAAQSALANRIAERLNNAGEADAAVFATQALAEAPAEDLTSYDEAGLAAATLAFARFAAERPQGTRKLRIYNPTPSTDGYESPNTIIETIGADQPFLIDSCLAALTARSLAIKALWHPVLTVTRDAAGRRAAHGAPIRESMIRVEIDRLTLPASLKNLEMELSLVFSDVALAVRDWRPMLAKLDEAQAALRANPPPLPTEGLQEAEAFLGWLKADHFTFLGCRDYTLNAVDGGQSLDMEPETGLGLLSDPARRIVRRDSNHVSLSPELQVFINTPTPLIITKANTRSNVHRRVHMDYIGVKRFDADGKVIGERRFVGLFTSSAYSRNVREIPYLRQKVVQALDQAGFDPRSYYGKNYLHILEDFPRDELFQISADELHETSLGILRLVERPRTDLFIRWDQYDRFVSVLVYMPRESYSTNIRIRIMNLLTSAFNGRPTAYHPHFGDEMLTRVHFIIGRNEGPRPAIDLPALRAAVAQVARRWEEGLELAATAMQGEEKGTALYEAWRDAFGPGYKEDFPAGEALIDIEAIGTLTDEGLGVRLSRSQSDGSDHLRVKLYHRGSKLALSDVLPILERMGLRVLREQNYPVITPDGTEILIHDILMRETQGRSLDLSTLKASFEAAFRAIWSGRSESDGLNCLILRAGLDWRDVTILRAITRYLRQAAIPYSRDYMEEALGNNAPIAALIVALFHTRFDPAGTQDRDAAQSALSEKIESALTDVASLDEDRILRRFANLVSTMQRTSYYQDRLEGETVRLSFKLASRAVLDLPEPRPFAEIFVYSPRFEGVHLRFGKVARGGLRWSDRREDFRTEILGLVKAQRVKNAVIVPVGAKGGFVPKQIALDAMRDTVQAEGVACYKLFVSALLALTDNIVDGEVVPPEKTIRHDENDPYLVVAADKGTATFSDIANNIALAHGFWLGDAFASGGSQGYDHKKMGITARGAWEAVKRHFRELGRDIQTEPFTVVGVGDMSGDVFGNGMLLSRETRLVAAFDHRDIFIDPTPDPAKSFAERKRLFTLPRSSWADYDKCLISKGGGVFSRKLKAIPLSDEMKKLSGLTGRSAAPQDLIRALLKAEIDLLWFGGIGTFVKGTQESHLMVGDRANDALRIDGQELRAKVVGEGANLGCTQAGRVEYARKGGRLNTDAIDNSAGVDTSDHEVNIKILLDAEHAAGRLEATERLSLLTGMTEEVGALVLETNYAQTRALSVSEATAPRDLSRHARFIDTLEQRGLLNPALERLPDRETLRALEAKGLGLTRPDLAVLLAYAKMALDEDILESDVPDDGYFVRELLAYFPEALRHRFADAIQHHRLRREIIAMRASNALVNLTGPTSATILSEEAGRPPSDAVRAFVIARAVHEIEPLRIAIDTLDNEVPAILQTEMHHDLKAHMQAESLWLLKHGPRALAIEETITRYGAAAKLLKGELSAYVTPALRQRVAARETDLVARGAPRLLAHDIAALALLSATGDVTAVAEESRVNVADAARALFTIGEALALDRLDVMIAGLKTEGYWDGIARARLSDGIAVHRRRMAVAALSEARQDSRSGEAAALAWLEARKSLDAVSKMIAEFEQSGFNVAKLAVLEGVLREL